MANIVDRHPVCTDSLAFFRLADMSYPGWVEAGPPQTANLFLFISLLRAHCKMHRLPQSPIFTHEWFYTVRLEALLHSTRDVHRF